MSYTDFSTKNADYRLILSMHLKKNKESVKGLDAIVLEGADGTIAGTLEGGFFGNMYGTAQYLHLIKTAEKEKITLYNADVMPRIFLALIEIVAFGNFYPGVVPSFLNFVFYPAAITSFFKGKTLPGLTDYVGLPTWLIQGAIMELRNAICARKTEEFIAPREKEKLGRKPKIGIVYGAMHAGIKLDLKYKKMRDFTIWNHKKLNFKEYFGLSKKGVNESLNKVEEANYENDVWVVKKHNLEGMF